MESTDNVFNTRILPNKCRWDSVFSDRSTEAHFHNFNGSGKSMYRALTHMP